MTSERLAQKGAHAQLAGRIGLGSMEPLTENPLSVRISGKKILMVFCDEHFEESSKLVSEMVQHKVLPQGLAYMRWSELYRQLPFISADAVVVTSLPPDELTRDPAALASYIGHFRERNPKSSVVMLNLYGTTTPAGSVFAFLEKEGLVDRAEPGPVSYDALLKRGADLMELKSL
jgi:hypothetical protein